MRRADPTDLTPLLHIVLAVLGAVLPGVAVYVLARGGCPAPAAEPAASACWEPVVAATLAAAFGWVATHFWLRLRERPSA